jgi:hypothetical protein
MQRVASATPSGSEPGPIICGTSTCARSAMLWPASSGAVRWAMKSRCQSPSGLPKEGEVPHRINRFTSSGRRATTSCATMAPMLCPSRMTEPPCSARRRSSSAPSRASISAMQLCARPLKV